MSKILKVIIIVAIIILACTGIVILIKNNQNENKSVTVENSIENSSTVENSSIDTDNQESDKISYQNENYTCEYLKDWQLIGTVDTNRAGPYSVYLGAIEIEIPAEDNSENTSSLYIKVLEEEETLDQYKEKIRKENVASPSEYYEEIDSSDIKFKNAEGFQITSEISDGESEYIKQDIFTSQNKKIYKITFFGPKEAFNQQKEKIKDFINNFEIL